MDVQELLKIKRDDIIRVSASHGASNVRVFGSVARNEAEEESDIDFLVEFDPSATLFSQVALIRDLETLLGREVDVLTEDGLHWYIRDQVLAEAISL